MASQICILLKGSWGWGHFIALSPGLLWASMARAVPRRHPASPTSLVTVQLLTALSPEVFMWQMLIFQLCSSLLPFPPNLLSSYFISLSLPLCLCQPQPLLGTPVYFLSSCLCLHLSLSLSGARCLLSGYLAVCLCLSLCPSLSPFFLCLPSKFISLEVGQQLELGTSKCLSGPEAW